MRLWPVILWLSLAVSAGAQHSRVPARAVDVGSWLSYTNIRTGTNTLDRFLQWIDANWANLRGPAGPAGPAGPRGEPGIPGWGLLAEMDTLDTVASRGNTITSVNGYVLVVPGSSPTPSWCFLSTFPSIFGNYLYVGSYVAEEEVEDDGSLARVQVRDGLSVDWLRLGATNGTPVTLLGVSTTLSGALSNTVTDAAVSNALHQDVRWDDLDFPAVSFMTPAVNKPELALTATLGEMYGLGWEIDDLGFATRQFPHNLARTNAAFGRTGLVVYPHIHFSPTVTVTDGNSNVSWKATYEWANIGSNFIASAVTGSVTTTKGVVNAGDHVVADFPAITNDAASISSMFRVRLERVASAESNNTSLVILDSFDIHYPTVSWGSREPSAP